MPSTPTEAKRKRTISRIDFAPAAKYARNSIKENIGSLYPASGDNQERPPAKSPLSKGIQLLLKAAYGLEKDELAPDVESRGRNEPKPEAIKPATRAQAIDSCVPSWNKKPVASTGERKRVALRREAKTRPQPVVDVRPVIDSANAPPHKISCEWNGCSTMLLPSTSAVRNHLKDVHKVSVSRSKRSHYITCEWEACKTSSDVVHEEEKAKSSTTKRRGRSAKKAKELAKPTRVPCNKELKPENIIDHIFSGIHLKVSAEERKAADALWKEEQNIVD
jgi:hypothetical protein